DDPEELLLVRDALHPHRAQVAPVLWKKADDLKATDDERHYSLAALATLDSASPRWQQTPWPPGETLSAKTPAAFLAERLLAANPLQLGLWTDALRPVGTPLLTPLQDAFKDTRQAGRSVMAARLLANFARDLPELLAGLALDATDEQYLALRPALLAQRQK